MNLDQLEKLADAATPGPWNVGSQACMALDPDTYEIVAKGVYLTDAISKDACFIAAMNPEFVKQWIEVTRQMAEALVLAAEQTLGSSPSSDDECTCEVCLALDAFEAFEKGDQP